MIRKTAPGQPSGIGVKTPLALPDGRIGIMGGSFNPPHEGHLIVANTALRRLKLDRIWWLVTPGNPLKDHDDLAPLQSRIQAAETLTTDPRMQITAFEADLKTPYTAATLSFLKRRFSSTHFVWLMGADNLATFHRWQSWRDISRTMPIAVVDRPGWNLRALSSPAARTMASARLPETLAPALPGMKPPAWTFLTTRLSHQSSTALRQSNGPSVRK